MLDQERRQSRQRGIDQERDAALGQRADLGDREGQHVGGERHRLAMEIAARQHLVGVGEDQRVVGHAIGLDFEHRRREAEMVEAGAHDLGLAAQAIGILHARIVLEMRAPDRAAGQQGGVVRGDRALADMAAQIMDTRIKGRVAAGRGVDR